MARRNLALEQGDLGREIGQSLFLLALTGGSVGGLLGALAAVALAFGR